MYLFIHIIIIIIIIYVYIYIYIYICVYIYIYIYIYIYWEWERERERERERDLFEGVPRTRPLEGVLHRRSTLARTAHRLPTLGTHGSSCSTREAATTTSPRNMACPWRRTAAPHSSRAPFEPSSTTSSDRRWPITTVPRTMPDWRTKLMRTAPVSLEVVSSPFPCAALWGFATSLSH